MRHQSSPFHVSFGRWFSSQAHGSMGGCGVGFALLIERARLSQGHILQVVLSSYSSTSSLTNIYSQLRLYQHRTEETYALCSKAAPNIQSYELISCMLMGIRPTVTAVQLEHHGEGMANPAIPGSSNMDVSLIILALTPRTSTYGGHRPAPLLLVCL